MLLVQEAQPQEGLHLYWEVRQLADWVPKLGVSTGGAGAIAGMKTGAKIGSKIGKYPGNLTGSAAENAGKAIKVMTMDFDPIASGRKVKNIASDGIKKFMGNKKK